MFLFLFLRDGEGDLDACRYDGAFGFSVHTCRRIFESLAIFVRSNSDKEASKDSDHTGVPVISQPGYCYYSRNLYGAHDLKSLRYLVRCCFRYGRCAGGADCLRGNTGFFLCGPETPSHTLVSPTLLVLCLHHLPVCYTR